MKYIIILATITMMACCTPGTCPQEEVYINAVLQDGSEAIVRIPEGSLNNPDYYYTKEEFEKIMQQFDNNI